MFAGYISIFKYTLLGASLSTRYKEALLDDEVSIYMCSSVNSSVEERRRDLRDPVASLLLNGDSQVIFIILS